MEVRVVSKGEADDGSIKAADRSDEVPLSNPVLLIASAPNIVATDRGRVSVRLHVRVLAALLEFVCSLYLGGVRAKVPSPTASTLTC